MHWKPNHLYFSASCFAKTWAVSCCSGLGFLNLVCVKINATLACVHLIYKGKMWTSRNSALWLTELAQWGCSVAHRACAMRLPGSGGGGVIKWMAHVDLQNTPITKKSELSRKMREGLEPAASHLLCRLRTHLPWQLKTLSPLSMISLLEGPNGHTKQCLIRDRMYTGFLAFVDSASSKIIPGHSL